MITCGRKKKQYLLIAAFFFLNISKSGLLSLQELVPTASSREVPSTAFHSKIQPKSLFRIPNQRNYEDISVYVWVFFINWWGSSSACCLFAVSNQLSKYLLQVPCGLALHPVSLLIQMMVWYCPLARTQTAYKYTHPHGLLFLTQM